MTPKFHLIRKIDSFKSNWFLWECDREYPAGVWKHGTVQADSQGECVAEETFEAD